jgi:hypothetical protein
MLQRVTLYRDNGVVEFLVTSDWQKTTFAAPTPNRITVDVNGNRFFDSTVERMLASPFGRRQIVEPDRVLIG